jgi:alginate O-acetyltransferase complex protein AlgI
MLFNSFVFLFLFLPVTYLVFWRLPSANSRYAWLAVTGYVFYGYWDARFCILMAFSTVVSWSAGLGLLTTSDPRLRKLLLVVPITVDLLLLGFFKYAMFVLSSIHGIGVLIHREWSLPHLNIILPIGISFYTFHTITYIVDSYRGVIRPTRNFFEFAAYVSLFSQLVAGPIVRFRQIEADLENLGRADRRQTFQTGVTFFILGLVQKVLIADSLALGVDSGLSQLHLLSTGGAWLTALSYTFQLYFDFAGYSDMAVGLGYMFGIRIPQNFDSPYRATDPSDFWRRWHISLSSCLRDYLYIPLGGSRNGSLQTVRNLCITMLLGGLWHGANWTFVIWGGYHGLLLVLHRAAAGPWGRLPVIVQRLAMFGLTVIGWVMFRSPDLSSSLTWLGIMFTPTRGATLTSAPWLAVALVALWGWSVWGPNSAVLRDGVVLGWRSELALSALLGCCLCLMAGAAPSPFLYFQF